MSQTNIQSASALKTTLEEFYARRTRLESELADAIDEQDSAGLALAKNAGKAALATATQATSRVGAIKGALATIERAISERESELEEAHAREEREAQFTLLARLAADAGTKKTLYEKTLASLHKTLEKEVPNAAALFGEWTRYRTEFVNIARRFAPEFTAYYSGTSQEGRDAAEQLLRQLEIEHSANLDAVLARVTFWPTIVDRDYELPDFGFFTPLILDAIAHHIRTLAVLEEHEPVAEKVM